MASRSRSTRSSTAASRAARATSCRTRTVRPTFPSRLLAVQRSHAFPPAADHYQQLSSSWSHGPIYASQTTINLIKLKLGVKDEWLHALPLDETVKVDGIDVTLIDANQCVPHFASRRLLVLARELTMPLFLAVRSCPGSVLFLFEGPHTDPKSPYSKTPNRIFRYLHCGGTSSRSPCSTFSSTRPSSWG